MKTKLPAKSLFLAAALAALFLGGCKSPSQPVQVSRPGAEMGDPQNVYLTPKLRKKVQIIGVRQTDTNDLPTVIIEAQNLAKRDLLIAVRTEWYDANGNPVGPVGGDTQSIAAPATQVFTFNVLALDERARNFRINLSMEQKRK